MIISEDQPHILKCYFKQAQNFGRKTDREETTTRIRCRWEDNMRMYHKKIELEDVDWIETNDGLL
jgi:hypothetical protein